MARVYKSSCVTSHSDFGFFITGASMQSELHYGAVSIVCVLKHYKSNKNNKA